MTDWVVCLDGTKNREKTGTNVCRLHKMLCRDDRQEAACFPGGGTKTGEWGRGLLFGWGLNR